VYETSLTPLCLSRGKRRPVLHAQFVVALPVEMLGALQGRILDPLLGSAQMFVQKRRSSGGITAAGWADISSTAMERQRHHTAGWTVRNLARAHLKADFGPEQWRQLPPRHSSRFCGRIT